MLIEGPLKIAIAEPEDGQGKILVIGFQSEFQALDRSGQARRFRAYLEVLNENITAPEGTDERNRAGMLIVQQIAEQLLPHIESGDLVLEETMTVQIRQDEQAFAVSDLLARENP